MEKPPFKDELIDWRGRIKELQNNPDKVVREYTVGRTIFPETISLEGMMELCQRSKTLFQKLHDQFDLDVVNIDLVVGKNPNNKDTVFIVVDKINGESIKKLSELPVKAKDELDHFYSQIAAHLLDTYDNNGFYWDDFGNDQIVYNEEENKFVIVDVDFPVENYGIASDVERKEIENISFFLEIRSLLEAIEESEAKFDPPVKLDTARAKLLELLDAITKNEPAYDMVEALKRKLM